MKNSEITVFCIYREGGSNIEELLLQSFRLFLKRVIRLKQETEG